MTRLFLAAGVAALAIAMPASAKPGGGDKGGQRVEQRGGGGGGHKAERRGGGGHKVEFRGGGQQRFEARGGGQRFERRGGNERRFEARGGGQRFESRGGGERRFAAQKRSNEQRFEARKRGGEQRFEAQRRMAERRFENRKRGSEQRFEARKRFEDRRFEGGERFQERRFEDRRRFAEQRGKAHEKLFEQRQKQLERLAENRWRDSRQLVRLRDWDDRDRWDRGYSRGLVNGCPPGLWMKNNGCLPPGQAKKLVGNVIPAALRTASMPLAFSNFYRDTDDYYWRYNDGYMYQVDRTSNLVASLLPLIGGGYVPGSMFPTAYSPYYQSGYTFPSYYGNSYVPDYYGWNAFYPDTPYVDYRYLNGNVYGVDPYTGLIEDVIPTYGYGYGVGQILPAGYGYYNVPYGYRDMYYNTPDYNYWYAPGAIYQVDPTSQLITAVASLLAPGLSIGQPLPMGYDVYNVPYAYRQTYYDTPNAWYRYNNGNIYQVDPTTRLVTAIVASLLT